ncbi:PREDICTED: fermitin family homolog 3-like [Haliaeetus leucocephalus]|uniref:fermitin family homolog 3-like n=1 Tax=Haliaeetus leucocephalus TaxID=52644 RepID=UPI00053CC19E|nr:PREDICTED: fermitin family homolog 3-like [Haliaeetus leucocephalus]
MAGLKTASGEAIDGSFELQVEVEEGDAVGQAGSPPAAPRALALRVTGDLHVGGLMLLIVETVGVQRDWSDHALWWAQRRQWLLRPGRTLDALGVGGDARLRFAPQHRPLRLRLPNRRRLRLRLSFAQPLAHVVAQACRLLEGRHWVVLGVTGAGCPQEELTTVPELAEELEIYRPRKLTLRGFRPTWAVLKETSLSYGRSPPLVPRILEVLHRVGALSPAQARLRFLEAWRALPGFGLAYFLVRFKGSRRDEVLGVGPSRLLRLDPGTGSVTRAWRYSALRQWNVNWDTQQVTLELEGEVTLALCVLSAPCQALHEFLGGYLCLGGRQPGQPLDLRLFHKLTGGQEPL